MDSTCIHISSLIQSRQDIRYVNIIYLIYITKRKLKKKLYNHFKGTKDLPCNFNQCRFHIETVMWNCVRVCILVCIFHSMIRILLLCFIRQFSRRSFEPRASNITFFFWRWCHKTTWNLSKDILFTSSCFLSLNHEINKINKVFHYIYY